MVSIGNNPEKTGTLYVVATPIGNLDDISQRALKVLEEVDIIAAEDKRQTRKLLSFYGLQTELVSFHEHNEEAKTTKIIDWLKQGKNIALVSDAGTPLISDPGYTLVKACRGSSLAVVPIPGSSAVITALSVSGLPTDSFRFCGFPPRQSGKRKEFFQSFSKETATLVFYESSHRILDCLADASEVFGADRLACIARELTKLYETVVTDQLSVLREWVENDENQRKGEFVLTIQGVDADKQEDSASVGSEFLLKTLLEELPVKKAAALTAKLTGLRKNDLYQRALDLKEK